MDSREAKEILKLYRPGDTDSADPRMAEALEQARRDPELAAWFAQHRAVCAVIRSRLKGIPVPAGLKEKIIAGRMNRAKVIPLPRALQFLAAAAAIVLLFVLGRQVFTNAPEGNTLANYRDRMARSVQRGSNPYMAMASTNQAEIRDYFRTNGAPVDYVLSKNLTQLPGEGGSVVPWFDQNVEMLCLNGGTDTAGKTIDVWVFIAKRAAVRDAPAPGAPAQFLTVGQLMTASWAAGDKIYLLATRGQQEDLQKYLE